MREGQQKMRNFRKFILLEYNDTNSEFELVDFIAKPHTLHLEIEQN